MNDRGIILLSVLWVVLILSVISLSLAAAVRTEVSGAGDNFDSERAFFMAKGAAEVVFQDLVTDGDLFADSPVEQGDGEFIFPFETGEVRVRLETGQSRIDINHASDVLLASMFDSLGIEQDVRNRLVDSILDWRDGDDIPHLFGAERSDYDSIDGRRNLPANGAFQSVDELLFVKGLTGEIFYGRLTTDPVTGEYRRIPGVRDLVTVDSDSSAVNANEASSDVLRALPGVDRLVADAVVDRREDEAFSSLADLVDRVPTLNDSDALEFLTLESGRPRSVVARARVTSSGVSRTVRIILREEERLQILSLAPLLYRRLNELKLDRWQYE